MKELLFLAVITFCAMDALSQAKAQNYIRGYVVDRNNQQLLEDATVALLRAKDSSAVTTVFTNNKGAFELAAVPVGNYYLYITYLGYEPVIRSVTISDEQQLTDLDTITLQRRGLTLATIEVIEMKLPMVMKKDTLEFNAGSFKTRENAVIEELLKKLPGVQVSRDGTIKVNGETVKKLLVDGRPFFGDDPKIATRNLTADMIDKVQFIDRKSNWAQFTGVSDGQTEKTINITIKKDKKNGYFGRLGGGYGADNHFAGSANLNRFSGGQQTYLLGSVSNINGYQDDGGQSRMAAGSSGDILNWNGGGNYSMDIGDKMRIGASYFMNKTHADNRRKSERQNILPDTTWYYNQNMHSLDNNTNHALNAWVEYKPDSMYMLNVAVNISYLNGNNLQEDQYTSLDEKQQLLNSGVNHVANKIKTPNVSTTIFFGKRFKKPGRAFSVNLSMGYNSDNHESFNMSQNSFVQPNGSSLIDTINQSSIADGQHNMMSLSLAYMEPLFKGGHLEFTYAYTRDYASSHKLTYDFNVVKGKYDRLNDSLSNAFENMATLQNAGINLHIQKERYDYSLGLNTQINQLANNNITVNERLAQHTVNFFPTAVLNYSITQNKRFVFSYAGSTQQPSPSQLQPVPDNSNPLYIQKGNPDLQSSFTHTFGMSYTMVNPTTQRNFSANMNYSLITNKIVNISWFDSLGRQVSQPLNVNGAYSINTNVSNSFPLKKEQTAVNASTSLGINRDISYINGIRVNTLNYNISPNISFNYAYKELFDFNTIVSANYNRLQYSVQKDNNTQYLNYTFSFDFNLRLPLDVSIGGNLDYLLSTGRAAGYNQDAAMLNAFISKTLFKRRQGLIRFQGFDLLNRNIGINRNLGTNYIEDVKSKVLQRLFMVSFSYFLKK